MAPSGENLRKKTAGSAETANGGRTLVETAYAQLRHSILHGEFEPGAKLRTEELRARYNISGSTVREALTRLLGETLVTAEGQRGFRVAPISLEDFTDLANIRKLLETETLRNAIAHGDDAWEARVVGAYHRLSRIEEKINDDPDQWSDEWEARNKDFHQALASGCPSRWLAHLSALMYQQSERYRRIAIRRRSVPRDVHAEHKEILEATLARDADRACALLGEHIDRTIGMIARFLADKERKKPERTATRAKGLAKSGALA